MLFDELPKWLNLIIMLGGAAAVIFGLWKSVIKPAKGLYNKVNSGMDTLLGYPPVLDPGSGKELKPATPALALRVDNLEEAQTSIAQAVASMAHTNELVMELQKRWDERDKVGTQIVKEWTDWRNAHELEAQKREERLAEWEVWRQEQNMMMESMKNVHDLPHSDALN